MRPVVLIVDDMPSLCRAIARELAGSYDVVIASSYQGGCALIGQHPELVAVVSDLLLGGGADGLDLLAAARTSAPGAARLLITGTSHTLPGGRAEVVDAVIAKPWPFGHVLATIERLRAEPRRPPA